MFFKYLIFTKNSFKILIYILYVKDLKLLEPLAQNFIFLLIVDFIQSNETLAIVELKL